jgi:hypothetical protein
MLLVLAAIDNPFSLLQSWFFWAAVHVLVQFRSSTLLSCCPSPLAFSSEAPEIVRQESQVALGLHGWCLAVSFLSRADYSGEICLYRQMVSNWFYKWAH